MKRWDASGKGEIRKAGMRVNLRKCNFEVSSKDADALFDSWDESGDGTLDFGELKEAFSKMQVEAAAFDERPAEGISERDRILEQAALFDQAAAETARAIELEAALEDFSRSLRSRGDVMLGELLQRRKVTPGEVVITWASSKGDNEGELSKVRARPRRLRRSVEPPLASRASADAVTLPPPSVGQADFRRAVLNLFAGCKATATEAVSDPIVIPSGSFKQRTQTVTASEIDAVFDTFDAVRG